MMVRQQLRAVKTSGDGSIQLVWKLEEIKIGWEAWTRTRIARSRVWSPTNWTTSQLMRNSAAHASGVALDATPNQLIAEKREILSLAALFRSVARIHAR